MRKKGFTLTELLIVMSIIGILSSIVLVGVKSSRERANVSKAKADVSQIALALTMRYADTRTYPAAPGVSRYDLLNNSVTPPDFYTDGPYPVSGWKGDYYKGNVNDPWGGEYQLFYKYIDPNSQSAGKTHVAIVSNGKDLATKCDDIFKSLKDNGNGLDSSLPCPNYQGQVE